MKRGKGGRESRVLVLCRNGGWARGRRRRLSLVMSCSTRRRRRRSPSRLASPPPRRVPLSLSLSLAVFVRPRTFRSSSFVARKMCVCRSERPKGRRGCPWDFAPSFERRRERGREGPFLFFAERRTDILWDSPEGGIIGFARGGKICHRISVLHEYYVAAPSASGVSE